MAYFLVIIPLFQTLLVAAVPYVVTSYVEVDISVITGLTLSYFTRPDKTISNTFFISPTISAIPTGLSTVTTSDQVYSYLNVVEILVPSGVGSTITGADLGSTTLLTDYFVPVTYELLSSCTGKKLVVVSTVSVDVPPPVRPFITPVAISTSATSYTIKESTTTETDRYTTVRALLNPTDIPTEQYSSASQANEPAEVSICLESSKTVTQTAHTATGTISSEGITCGSDNPTCEGCEYYIVICIGDCPPEDGSYYECEGGKKYWKKGPPKHINKLALAIALPVTWGFLWFYIGLVYHFAGFKKVMNGKEGRFGGLPGWWACCFLCLSWITLGRWYERKNYNEQQALSKQWQEASNWKRTWWYLRWGFGWTYPSILGTKPASSMRSKY